MRKIFLAIMGALCAPVMAEADVCRDVFVKCVEKTGNPSSCSMAFKTCQANPAGISETSEAVIKIIEKPVTWKLRKSANPNMLDVIIHNPNDFWVSHPHISIEFICQNGTKDKLQFGPSLLVDHIGPSAGLQTRFSRSVCAGSDGAMGFSSVSINGIDSRKDQVMFLEYGKDIPTDQSCRNVFPCDGSSRAANNSAPDFDRAQSCPAMIRYRDNELAKQMQEAFKLKALGEDLRSLWKEREIDTMDPATAQQVRLAERSLRVLDAIAEFISGFTPDGGLLKDAAESSSKFVKTVAVFDEGQKLLDQTALMTKIVQAPDANEALAFIKSEAATAAKAVNAVVFHKYKHVRTALNMNISSLETVKKISDAKEIDAQWGETIKMLQQGMNRINFEIEKWTQEIERANLEIRLVNELKTVIDQVCSD